jgi:hypothetical protein
LVAACVLGLALVGGCSRKPDPPPKPPTVAKIVNGCTPFYSAYGHQRLTFTTAPDRPLTIRFRHHPIVRLEDDGGTRISDGSYAIDEPRGMIAISLGSMTTRYSVHSYGADHCALLLGDLQAANIKASWFGSWPPDDSDDDDGGDRY